MNRTCFPFVSYFHVMVVDFRVGQQNLVIYNKKWLSWWRLNSVMKLGLIGINTSLSWHVAKIILPSPFYHGLSKHTSTDSSFSFLHCPSSHTLDPLWCNGGPSFHGVQQGLWPWCLQRQLWVEEGGREGKESLLWHLSHHSLSCGDHVNSTCSVMGLAGALCS